jgi:hypothetical protein
MKRTAKQNIYGNWVGYCGRKRVEEFGDHASSEADAAEWVATGTNENRSSYNS